MDMEYNELEKEVRNPASALRNLILGDKEPTEEEIYAAIKEDIGWSEEDIGMHLSFYSDWYKDLHGVRPHGCYPDPVAEILWMWEEKKLTSAYEDVSVLKRMEELEEEAERRAAEEEAKRLEGVTLNGVALTPETARAEFLKATEYNLLWPEETAEKNAIEDAAFLHAHQMRYLAELAGDAPAKEVEVSTKVQIGPYEEYNDLADGTALPYVIEDDLDGIAG